MDNVQFDEDLANNNLMARSKQSKFVGMLIKFGLAKNEKTANRLLISVAVVCGVSAIVLYLYYSTGYNPLVKGVVTQTPSSSGTSVPAIEQSSVLHLQLNQ